MFLELRQDRYAEPGFWLRLGRQALYRTDRGDFETFRQAYLAPETLRG